MKHRARVILIDILGFTLIFAAVPISWLPGPGGIPMLIIGLSLLANNHEWAERLLHRVKSEGLNLFQKVFDGGTKTKWAVDLLSVAFIAIAVIVLDQLTRNIKYTVGISLIISGSFMFFSNRNRYKSLVRKFLKKHKR